MRDKFIKHQNPRRALGIGNVRFEDIKPGMIFMYQNPADADSGIVKLIKNDYPKRADFKNLKFEVIEGMNRQIGDGISWSLSRDFFEEFFTLIDWDE